MEIIEGRSVREMKLLQHYNIMQFGLPLVCVICPEIRNQTWFESMGVDYIWICNFNTSQNTRTCLAKQDQAGFIHGLALNYDKH